MLHLSPHLEKKGVSDEERSKFRKKGEKGKRRGWVLGMEK